MFRTYFLSVISSLNTVFTAIGICHTGYVDCLLARSTCFDTVVSSSGRLYSIPCQGTQVFQMQLLVIQFTIKMF